MSARHHIAIAAVRAQESDVKTLVHYTSVAINECELLKKKYSTDSAVLLLVTQLAIATHADSTLKLKYRILIDKCLEETNNDLAAVQSPNNVN
jgi:hypothetical protein